MPPKADPSEVKYLTVRVVGGEVPGGTTLAPKLGPLGLNAKVVGENVAKTTAHLKGLKLTIQLKIQNRQAEVSILPSASSLIIAALKEPPRDRKKEKNRQHNGDLKIENIYEIARTMRSRSMARFFSGTVKEILGTAFSVGCTVDGKSPRDVCNLIDEGAIVVPAE